MTKAEKIIRATGGKTIAPPGVCAFCDARRAVVRRTARRTRRRRKKEQT